METWCTLHIIHSLNKLQALDTSSYKCLIAQDVDVMVDTTV